MRETKGRGLAAHPAAHPPPSKKHTQKAAEWHTGNVPVVATNYAVVRGRFLAASGKKKELLK